MTVKGSYFYGNKISDYGLENQRVDYATLAKAFNHVLANDIISELSKLEFYFEPISGCEWYYEIDGERYSENEREELIDKLEDELWELEEGSKEYEKLLNKIEEATNSSQYYSEVFQYYIISPNGVEILKEIDEIVYYNETLNLYIWGVTHYGTSWGYVLTDICIELPEQE